MQTEVIVSIISVSILAAIHPVSARISHRHIRRWTISMCAGIALAYVFMHLLPELANMQFEIIESRGGKLPELWFREHLYVLALAGLLLFQIVDSMGRRKGISVAQKTFSYRAEILFFALYAALIGYLIIENARLDQPLLLITFALAAHFFGTDLDLAERYNDRFVKHGSYILSLATISGMIVSMVMRVNDVVYMAGFSFLAGGLLINTLRTELPEPERVKNLFLLLGAVIYSVLILYIYMRSRS